MLHVHFAFQLGNPCHKLNHFSQQMIVMFVISAASSLSSKHAEGSAHSTMQIPCGCALSFARTIVLMLKEPPKDQQCKAGWLRMV